MGRAKSPAALSAEGEASASLGAAGKSVVLPAHRKHLRAGGTSPPAPTFRCSCLAGSGGLSDDGISLRIRSSLESRPGPNSLRACQKAHISDNESNSGSPVGALKRAYSTWAASDDDTLRRAPAPHPKRALVTPACASAQFGKIKVAGQKTGRSVRLLAVTCKLPTPAFAYNSRREIGRGKYPRAKSAGPLACASIR